MADDNDDWFASADDEPEPEVAAAPAAAAASEAPAAAEGGGGAEPAADAPAGEEKREEAAEEEFLDPDKLLLFKHWIRPKFLQYRYLYDYRQNYYNDVIDYMDKRARGIDREIPRAQTWAERTLRTYKDKRCNVEAMDSCVDKQLIERTILSGEMFRYHFKDSINRRYSKLLY